VDPIVTIASGRVRGRSEGGVRRFFGIPYTAAPVGPLRFALPQPHAPWDDVLDAVEPGPNAPQIVRPFPGLDIAPLIGHGWIKGDDFLSLNIWAPDDDAPGKPVMVFIHGGAWVLGSKDAAVQDGSAFARSGVVCVSINYRLGIEGFLPIPGVPTNLGLRDQIFALEWVRDTIANFGGDPGNVTVFGESAGAMSIATLVPSPLAKGLFRRAIIQSGHGAMTRSIPVMERLVTKIAALLKVAPTAEGFATVTPEQALVALQTVSNPKARIDLRDEAGREPTFGLSRFTPVHGDDVVPLPPHEALRQGRGAEVDVLIGTNRDEMNLYFVTTGVRAKLNRLLAWIALGRVQPKAWTVLKAYGAGRIAAGHAFTAALTDLVFRWPARRFAEEHRGRTHLYDFSWASPIVDGASHGIELPFVFDTLATTTGPQGLTGTDAPQALAESVHALWVGFARDGTLPWPAFDSDSRQVYDPATTEVFREEPMPAAIFLP